MTDKKAKRQHLNIFFKNKDMNELISGSCHSKDMYTSHIFAYVNSI